ncbi:hypothetical protein EK21DRAFT_84386 [Setomelanomma holmii]|uniref:DUF7730 domain-containing protein n=1 Tax=Setomelanomma holmii TaxID=210430 RepID=A0A9P4HN43_9PLEO|nr:hypothetical protein EK21DRAFT_84386 [Setomelanomma holmii]
MPWRSPKEIYKRYKLHREKKKQKARFQKHENPSSSRPRVDSKVDAIVPFSRKEIILKTSTPVRPGPPLKHHEPVVDLWDKVDSKRREISTRNQRESPLLRLPSEVRNVIYELVLGGKTFKFKDAVNRGHASMVATSERHVLGLLYTCHQIYSEASLLPYSLNTFSFREFDVSLEPFLSHRRLAHNRAITSIELVTYQAARMWAAPDGFSEDFKEIEETEVIWRFPNLREIRVIVDLNVSLYVVYGTRDFDFRTIRQAQRDMEDAINAINPNIVVRFFWA